MSDPKPLEELLSDWDKWILTIPAVDHRGTVFHAGREMARRLRKLAERHKPACSDPACEDSQFCACGIPLPCPDAEILEGKGL